MRIGIGYDVHLFAEGRKLFLGGVEIPYVKGLAGHSDADVLLHAISDALLGAIAEGDTGTYFPDSDPTCKDMESINILSFVHGLIKKKGCAIVNIDAIVVTEEPKIYPYRDTIRQRIAQILEIPIDRVSIKGKTAEGLGFVGKKEGIEVFAVALVEEIRTQDTGHRD